MVLQTSHSYNAEGIRRSGGWFSQNRRFHPNAPLSQVLRTSQGRPSAKLRARLASKVGRSKWKDNRVCSASLTVFIWLGTALQRKRQVKHPGPKARPVMPIFREERDVGKSTTVAKGAWVIPGSAKTYLPTGAKSRACRALRRKKCSQGRKVAGKDRAAKRRLKNSPT